jgi:hypothetical protein
MEKKALEFKIDGGKLVISLDTNKDGEPVCTFAVDLAEVPDEVLAVIKK